MRYFLILLAALCASCGTALPTIKPYKLDVQQGNVVTSKMLLQLRPSMTKSQVRFIMGTPLIQDSFHGNRWDYVYQMRESGKITEQRRVILDFENDVLKTVRGDVIPAVGDKSSTDENIGTRTVKAVAKPEEKSLISKLKFWEKDEAELAQDAAAVKAKIEADEIAKKSVSITKENVTAELVAPAEQPSMMAVPLDVTPLVEAPAAAANVPVSSAVIVSAPSAAAAAPEVKAPVVQTPVVQTPDVQAVVVTQAITAALPATPPPYDSQSGMKFDRALRLASEDLEPAAQPTLMPRAGNKTAPKPKDLPAESSPSFFDKMLEKIGF